MDYEKAEVEGVLYLRMDCLGCCYVFDLIRALPASKESIKAFCNSHGEYTSAGTGTTCEDDQETSAK